MCLTWAAPRTTAAADGSDIGRAVEIIMQQGAGDAASAARRLRDLARDLGLPMREAAATIVETDSTRRGR